MDAKSKFQRKKKNNAKGNKGLTSPKQRAKKKQKLKKKKKNQAARKKARNKKVIGERAQKNKGWSLLKTLKVYFGKHDPIVFEPGVMDIVEMLNFNQLELRKMKYVFEKADIDMMGEVDYDELMELVQHPRSPYTDALMSLIDPEGTGIITFQGFFQIIATYSMYTEEDILRFAFTTFDKDSSGTIDEEEFMDLCKTINNANPAFPANFKGALEQFDRNDDALSQTHLNSHTSFTSQCGGVQFFSKKYLSQKKNRNATAPHDHHDIITVLTGQTKTHLSWFRFW